MDPTYPQLIGERIRLARGRLRLPCSGLAKLVGVSGAAVSHWEQGKQCPSVALLPCLSRELRVSVEYLLGGPENPIPPAGSVTEVQRAARHAVAAIMGVAPDRVEVEFRFKD